jgi:hypothetical protein
LESIRPDGRHGCKLGPRARHSCTVYPATEIEIEAPGVIGRVYGNNSPLGEPSGKIGVDVNRSFARPARSRIGCIWSILLTRLRRPLFLIGCHTVPYRSQQTRPSSMHFWMHVEPAIELSAVSRTCPS